jgi:hypothetical protein
VTQASPTIVQNMQKYIELPILGILMEIFRENCRKREKLILGKGKLDSFFGMAIVAKSV